MISLLTLMMSLLGPGLALTETDEGCPADKYVNVGYSESLGCVWADIDETHRFDNYEDALNRCK